MSKKVSSLLFRINKFNNYKNIWVFNYNKQLNTLLDIYYKFYKFFTNNFLIFKIIFFNNIYIIYVKLNINKINYKFIKKFIYIYNIFKFYKKNLFLILYKLNTSIVSVQFLKLFIKFNLRNFNSIQNLYYKLYANILIAYINQNFNYIGLKIIISGRLNNTKLATSEIFQFGSIALQKIDIFIYYEKFYLITKYGILGIKIWLGKS